MPHDHHYDQHDQMVTVMISSIIVSSLRNRMMSLILVFMVVGVMILMNIMLFLGNSIQYIERCIAQILDMT